MGKNLSLEALIGRKQQLEARIQRLKAKTSTQNRKDETRRKILAGAYLLDKHNKEGNNEKLIYELDKFLFRPDDRALFGLAPRKTDEVTSKVQERSEP